MILGKVVSAIRAQLNKLANLLWEKDPIAQMQYEYDRAVQELKEGRIGLEQYAGFVERVQRQVTTGRGHVATLEAQTKAYLKAGNREAAARFALELQKARTDLAENEAQLELHQTAYDNNLKKIQHANRKLAELKNRIQRYDAELKMSSAEAEIAKLSETFEMNLTTDFGQLEDVIQRKIDSNKGRTRVAADLSSRGIEAIRAEEAMESQLAEDALVALEIEMGIRTPETIAPVTDTAKDLGPAVEDPQSA